MAELVKLNLEKMLPELEALAQIQIFTQDEVRRIIKKRKEFEYKILRGTKGQEDLLEYIGYERTLMTLVKNTTIKDKSFDVTRNKIVYSFIRHIQWVYSEALVKFEDDVKFWLSYMDFCTQLRLIPALSKCLESMLKVHKDKPQLFCTAAQTEFNLTGDMVKARGYLLKGMKFNKKSELLYREAFAMELTHVKKTRSDFVKRREPVPVDDELSGRLAEMVYESSMMNIRSIDLASELYTISENFPFAARVKERIYKDIYDKFKDKELRWDIVARHELENPQEELSTKDAIKACVAVYEEAVKTLDTETMWSYYIDAMWSLNEDLSYLKNFKKNCLTHAFLEAHGAEKLTEEYYLKWATKLEAETDKEKRKQVMECGTVRFPGSVKLWKEYLVSLTLMDTPYDVMLEHFNAAESQLKANKTSSLPIWKFFVHYTYLKEPSKAEDIMKKGAAAIDSGEVAVAVRIQYLNWLALSKGVSAARSAYAEYASMPPFSLQFHQKMIELENHCDPDVDEIRKCYEAMISQFGNEDANVWLDYVKFEQANGEPRKVPELYSRAEKSLQPGHAETFIALYSLYQIQLDISHLDEDEPSKKQSKPSTSETAYSVY